MAYRSLTRQFYNRDPLEVAPDLLGKYLIVKSSKFKLVGKIVETEAYRGKDDPASHAYRGQTERNKTMFGLPGLLYVYFTYGMHYCMNVVCNKTGLAGAVLLRAVEPLEGIEIMRTNRHLDGYQLTNGPAKLCQAFGIDKRYDGYDLINKKVNKKSLNHVSIAFNDTKSHIKYDIKTSPRIGIKENTAVNWRFFIYGNTYVS
jgi:DNA-3-methyladenine glycosylase